MRIALLSDIHANRHALEAVLLDSQDQEAERFWYLGDAVGYGPDPAASLTWLQRYVDLEDWVVGNHDAMLANLLTPAQWQEVNHTPRLALDLNRQALAEKPQANDFWQRYFTRERMQPRHHELDGVHYLLVHASQVDLAFRYVYAWQVEFLLPAEFRRLQEVAQTAQKPCVQVYGHTHVPTLVQARPQEEGFRFEATRIFPGQSYSLDGQLYLLNPGSVGQPRDLDNRAAYAVLDTETHTVTFHRVPYEFQRTTQLMHGYPSKLIGRLRDADVTKETPDPWLDHYRQAATTISYV